MTAPSFSPSSETTPSEPTWSRPREAASSLRILLVEDEPDVARLVTRRLEWSPSARFEVLRARDLDEALAQIEAKSVDAVLLDLSLPGSRGLETLGAACAVARHVPIVVLTGSDDDSLASAAIRAGAQDYLIKEQQDGRTLVRAVLHAIARHRRESALAEGHR